MDTTPARTAPATTTTQGAVQFNRAIKLTVGSPPDAIDLSQFRIKFVVTSATTGSPRTAAIRVYNLSDGTRNKIKKLAPAPAETSGINVAGTPSQSGAGVVFLEAGYVQNMSGIFSGGIVQTRSGRENPTDTFLDIFASDLDNTLTFGVLNITVAAGASDLDILNRVVSDLQAKGFPISVAYTAPSLGQTGRSLRSQTIRGLAGDILREICLRTGCTWHVTDGKLYLVPLTATLPGEAVLLTAGSNGDASTGTGLVGYPVQTESGIQARCLLNSGLRQTGKVIIRETEIIQAPVSMANQAVEANSQITNIDKKNTYKIIHLIHRGDTRGQEWYSEFHAIAVDATSVPSAAVLAMQVVPGG